MMENMQYMNIPVCAITRRALSRPTAVKWHYSIQTRVKEVLKDGGKLSDLVKDASDVVEELGV